MMQSESNSSELVQRSRRSNIFLRVVRLIRNIAIVGSIASWFASMHWIPDFLSHLRIQYAIVLLPCFTHAAIRRDRVMAVLLGGLFMYNAWPTLPYFFPPTPLANANLSEARHYRVLSFNVLRTNEQLEPTLEQILSQDADFVFLMEVQNEWKTHFEGIKNRYPYQRILTDPAYTGVAFLSKHPWKTLDVITLGTVSNPSIDVQIPVLDSALGSFRIIATHPLPPFGEILTDSRDQQLKVLAERFRLNEPNMMIGDLNLSPWSPRFATLLKIADLKDASLGNGISTTLAPLPTWFGGIKVDHVLTGGPIVVQQYRTQPSAYSDHKMVIVDFVVE